MIAQAGKDETSAHTPWRRRKRLARQHAEFLQWFKTKGLKKINLTALVTCDSAKGVGKKGKKGHRCTQRRTKCWKSPANSGSRPDQIHSRTSSTECCSYFISASDVYTTAMQHRSTNYPIWRIVM